jgi:hypothetical protein
MSSEALDPVVLSLLLALYFAPSLIVWRRREPAMRIFLFNLLTGWTLVGWAIVLVMALLPAASYRDTLAAPEPERLPCPYCAEPILAAARLCRHCRQPLDRFWASGAEIVDLVARRAR